MSPKAKRFEQISGLDFVRQWFPKARARDVEYILWEMTAYPVCGPEMLGEQLDELAAKCAPTHKRGWHRKLRNESVRLAAEIDEMAREFSTRLDPQEAI